MEKIIEDYIEEFKNQENVLGSLIFGLYARNEQRENSDVDVLGFVKKDAWRDFQMRDRQAFELINSSPEKARQFY